ncbi:MAG: nucleotidyltransferase domain-containing protein [Candidatus Thorarchaeota archaeon]|jgi:predicted nucleotidyltransferase
MESRNIPVIWANESNQPNNLQVKVESEHLRILWELLKEAERDPNTLGFMVFGSVANGTYHEKSDIDVISILRSHKSGSGINHLMVDGVVVDSLHMTQEVFNRSVEKVPYLLYTMVGAKLLLDREGTVEPLLKKVRAYFTENPEIEYEWIQYFDESKAIKAETSCRAKQDGKTIIDVWNELERRYSDGRIKRPFFNSFYLTNPILFSLVKKFMVLTGGGK